jgi:hypothetical protein
MQAYPDVSTFSLPDHRAEHGLQYFRVAGLGSVLRHVGHDTQAFDCGRIHHFDAN